MPIHDDLIGFVIANIAALIIFALIVWFCSNRVTKYRMLPDSSPAHIRVAAMRNFVRLTIRYLHLGH